MTTDLDLTSTATDERSHQGRPAGRRRRRPFLITAAAAVGVAGVVVAVRAGTAADAPTPAPVVSAEPVVRVKPVAPVQPDWCVEHRPC
jgi:hypothetical protein